jgi:hypothetical protein
MIEFLYRVSENRSNVSGIKIGDTQACWAFSLSRNVNPEGMDEDNKSIINSGVKHRKCRVISSGTNE